MGNSAFSRLWQDIWQNFSAETYEFTADDAREMFKSNNYDSVDRVFLNKIDSHNHEWVGFVSTSEVEEEPQEMTAAPDLFAADEEVVESEKLRVSWSPLYGFATMGEHGDDRREERISALTLKEFLHSAGVEKGHVVSVVEEDTEGKVVWRVSYDTDGGQIGTMDVSAEGITYH